MYMTPRQKQRYFITTLILLIGLPITVFAAISAIRYFTNAGADTTPQNVVLTNLTSNSISITWTTDAQAAGSVVVNDGNKDSAPSLDSRGTDRMNTHYVEVVDLDPSKEYSFSILSNDEKYLDEKGKPFKFKTSPVSLDTPVPKPIYGSISGNGNDDVLVYIVLDDQPQVYPASSVTTKSGKWIVDLSALRNPDASTLPSVEDSTKITIIAKGQNTLGGVVSGTFGELVGGDGELASEIQLSDVPVSTLFAKIPGLSQISSVSSVVVKPDDTPDETPQTPEAPDDDFDIVQDSVWRPISGTESSSLVNAVVGGSSVKITNLTDTGFNIIWLSSKQEEGYVKYGTTPSALDSTVYDERDSATEVGNYHTHSVKLTRLLPETKYYFVIYSGTSTIQKSGNPFETTTFKTLNAPPDFKSVSGKISGSSDSSDVIVIVNIKSKNDGVLSTPSSTVVDDNGSWVATLGDLRTQNGSEYFGYTNEDSIIMSTIVYATSSPLSMLISNIEDTDITLSIKSTQTKRKIVKVDKLKDYGVYPL